ncbi:MAG: TetR/AcrR family transcriptional regulator [Alcanivorax sp.]|uniref:TetR/AcrR family transcriptional regulator n=2 Tax=Alloalcanivorax marinus TaxID=1177169 RepID=A0A9Q3UR17_9GAMM|nr:TetR/AcrR family transcriptional regulator [Alloalcanivorax marinus]MBM7333727.1 TetR/AcrR family transcriptional regulator [Alloalcanivorax marinus]MCC4309877.1 TetR/AcrR family transcriptional regulator [Alloalcanivorax marinus]
MRKQPQQKRSREMVRALVDATGLCIQRHGLDDTTTARIAEQAGVSVGSLYQYFGDKSALIEALMDRLAEDIAGGLRRLPLMAVNDLNEMVHRSIRFGFSVLRSRDGLYLELVRNWHRLPTHRMVDLLQQHFMELSRLYFLRHYRDYPIENLEVRVFIVTNSVLFTMVRHVSQGDVIGEEALARELTRMVAGYLAEPPETAAP